MKTINETLDDVIKENKIDEFIIIISKKILKELENKRYLFRKPYSADIGAIIYLAYRKANQPRSLNEVSTLADAERKEIGRKFRKIRKFLGMKYCLPEESSSMGTSCILIPEIKSFIPRIGEALKLSKKTINDAIIYAEKYEGKSNNSPVISAGTCLYISNIINNEKKTQREVADISGCTELALRQCILDVLKELKEIINLSKFDIYDRWKKGKTLDREGMNKKTKLVKKKRNIEIKKQEEKKELIEKLFIKEQKKPNLKLRKILRLMSYGEVIELNKLSIESKTNIKKVENLIEVYNLFRILPFSLEVNKFAKGKIIYKKVYNYS